MKGNSEHLSCLHLGIMADSSPPWRNNSFILGDGRDTALSDQGETIIGIYLLLLGTHTYTQNHHPDESPLLEGELLVQKIMDHADKLNQSTFNSCQKNVLMRSLEAGNTSLLAGDLTQP